MESSLRFINSVFSDDLSDTRKTAGLKQETSTVRVCDRCIVKKIRCDLKRPKCSTCASLDAICRYSSMKRKPGPNKGSRRGASASRTIKSGEPGSSIPSRNPIVQPDLDLSSKDLDYEIEYPGSVYSDMYVNLSDWSSMDMMPANVLRPAIPSNPSNSLLTIPQQRQLIHKFFQHLHSAVPLFHQDKFIDLFELGVVSGDLSLTICSISAKILGSPEFWDESNATSCLNHLMDNGSSDANLQGPWVLDSLRLECLLAFYAFHQYPGESSWMRIGNLTRKAYRYGLHQIDNSSQPRPPPFPIDDDALDDWRRLWWCIYCMDSYSNITAATPFLIETDNIRTSLLKRNSSTPVAPSSSLVAPVFLPCEIRNLWMTTQELAKDCGDVYFSIYIAATAVLREVGTFRRHWIQNPCKKAMERRLELEDHISEIRLSLPVRFLQGHRDFISNESGPAYNTRLCCVLQLHIARILLCLPPDIESSLDSWQEQWQQNLDHCCDFVTVIQQWDSQHMHAVDPAVCFMVFDSLCLLHLHSLSEGNFHSGLQERLSRYKNVLFLFLQQFAELWTLPQFLITCFQKFANTVNAPLMGIEVGRILAKFQGALNQQWLRSLPPSMDVKTPPQLSVPEGLFDSYLINSIMTDSDVGVPATESDNFAWL